MSFAWRLAAVALAAMTCGMVPAVAQQPQQQYQQPQQQYQQPQPQYQQPPAQQAQPQYQQPPAQPVQPMPPKAQASRDTYAPDELAAAGSRFFGNVSRGLASVIERAVSQWGLPNGYILGEEGSGA